MALHERRWWTAPGMTRPARVAAQARECGVYLDYFLGAAADTEVPTVLCAFGDQLWLLHPAVGAGERWVAGKARRAATDDMIEEVADNCRWIGPEDTPAADVLLALNALARSAGSN